METFSALLDLCAGNSSVPGEFPAQRPVTRSFDVFFDLRLKNAWVNNREAGDLRRHLVHYDVIVMKKLDVITPSLNTLRPRQNGRRFADEVFKCIFLNENVWISLKISLKFLPNVPINNIPALVQILAWRRSGDKPLAEPMMVSSLTHICVTRPQWVNWNRGVVKSRWHIKQEM